MKNLLLILLILSALIPIHGQTNTQIALSDDSISFAQIKTNVVYKSNQIISILNIPKKALANFRIEFAYNQSDLETTSSFAKRKNALAAINGGFFNMDEGGSATYFEINDTVINKNRKAELKWGVADSIINGAVVITKDLEITFQPANTQNFYEASKQEAAVLITGPLLLVDSKKMKLPNMKFSNKRHPRTCLCKTAESLVLVTIDGRQKEAEGMSLIELQRFLLMALGCTDAINLDGGGSTTMWTRDRGIINCPSDKSGERPVSNALLILEK